MIGLFDLWAISLALSGLALAIMCGLIIARLVSGRRDRQSHLQRQKLLPLLLNEAADEELQLPGMEKALTKITIELIELVRGDDKERLVATATRLGVPKSLREQLRKGTTRARIMAAEMLSHFSDDYCTEALERALEDRDPEVRLTAALSLVGSDRAPPLPVLIQKLELGTSEQSMLIVTLLNDLHRQRPDEVHALIEDAAISASLKAAAIEALASSGDYSLVPAITRLALQTSDEAPELPRYLRALGTLQHPAALPAIQKGLGSLTWWVRAAAAEAAGRIGLFETSYKLLDLLDDEDWWVSFRAAEALVRLGEPGLRLLQERSRCGSPRARRAAQMTLAEQAIAA